MTEHVVADKMTEFGIRYIVWLDGLPRLRIAADRYLCTIGPGGAGCFGFRLLGR